MAYALSRMMRLALIVMIAAAALVAERASAEAAAPTIQIRLTRAGLVVGVSRGSGTLFYNGRQYPLVIGGVSLGATVGVSQAELIGNVYNLRRRSDIAGTYTAAQAGLSVAGGRNVARLTNSRGVVLELRGRQVGFIFSIDLSGMTIRLR